MMFLLRIPSHFANDSRCRPFIYLLAELYILLLEAIIMILWFKVEKVSREEIQGEKNVITYRLDELIRSDMHRFGETAAGGGEWRGPSDGRQRGPSLTERGFLLQIQQTRGCKWHVNKTHRSSCMGSWHSQSLRWVFCLFKLKHQRLSPQCANCCSTVCLEFSRTCSWRGPHLLSAFIMYCYCFF